MFRELKFTPKSFDSVEDMEEYIKDSPNATNVFMGVTFGTEWENATLIPDDLVYSLRPPAAPRSEQSSDGFGSASGWLTNLLFPTRPTSDGPRSRRDPNEQF